MSNISYFVAAPPDDVTCNSSLGKIGEPLTLKCISAGAVPTADLSWTDNEGRYVNGGKTENLIHNIANVSKQDNGKEFTCSARNNATDILQTRPNCTLHLNVTCKSLILSSYLFSFTFRWELQPQRK